MAMTPISFTENDTYDILVTIYLIVRIILSFLITLLCGYQTILELVHLKRSKRKILTPRILTWISLTMFPIFRILYSAVIFKTHDFDIGSTVVYFGMWTTFFIFNIWIWISCVWMQLLYTFFISKEIRLKNSVKVWYFSWFVAGLALIYTILYTILARFNYNVAKTFYTAGFIAILVVFGLTLITNGIVLSNEMKKHEKKNSNNNSEKLNSSVVKIRRLAFTLLFTVVAALARDIAFLFVKSGPLDNIKTFSAFYTFVLETAQGIIVMAALADKPINYFKFKRVYKSTSPVSSSSGGGAGSSGSGRNTDQSGVDSYFKHSSGTNSYAIEMNSSHFDTSNSITPTPTIRIGNDSINTSTQDLIQHQISVSISLSNEDKTNTVNE